MVTVTYIEHNGRSHTVEVAAGISLMKAAIDNAVPGIDGDCGGACACATCHVQVPDTWWHLIGEPGPDEKEMLECAIGVTARSRLGCQIPATEALDGLIVHMPLSQR